MNAIDLAAETTQAWDGLNDKLGNWFMAAVSFLPELIIATFVFVGFYFAARVSADVTTRLLHRTTDSKSVSRLVTYGVKSLILFFGLFATLQILSLDKTVASLLAGAGVIGLALGFAFQEIAANFISGIFIALRKPYRETDIVQMDSYVGVVEEITLRTTNLRTFDGLQVLIPNKDMFTKPVINLTRTPERRVEININVGFEEDLERIEELVLKEVGEIPVLLKHRPLDFYYQDVGSSAITFQVRFWITYHVSVNYTRAKHLGILAIKRALDREGIRIAYPVQTTKFLDGGRDEFRSATASTSPSPENADGPPAKAARDKS